MKKIKINRQLAEAFEQQKQAFKQKFGRDPGPGDPVFFDPDADEPRFRTEAQIKAMQEQMCETMRSACIDPAVIYAYQVTGRLLTKENKRFLTAEELMEWNDAIHEYQSTHRTNDR